MTEQDETGFRSSDAWILFAIKLAADAGLTGLSGVIAAADAVQHAIVTKEELDGGLGRLSRAALIVLMPDRVDLTQAGNSLLARAARPGAVLLERQRAGELALGARPWQPGERPADARLPGEPEMLTLAEYQGAVRRYLSKSQTGHSS
jgi:hypothetical protein